MTDFTEIKNNLKKIGYKVTTFEKGCEAAEYIGRAIKDSTVGIGGSQTIKELNLYEVLINNNNDVYWHWIMEPETAITNAMTADYYITSVNAIAQSGEMVNIDGRGNRVSASLYGHKKVFYIIGKNKITKTYDDAIYRARNVAAPLNAKRLNKKTPCVVSGNGCANCNSPERICKAMVTYWGPMSGMETEVILIGENYGY